MNENKYLLHHHVEFGLNLPKMSTHTVRFESAPWQTAPTKSPHFAAQQWETKMVGAPTNFVIDGKSE